MKKKYFDSAKKVILRMPKESLESAIFEMRKAVYLFMYIVQSESKILRRVVKRVVKGFVNAI